jgi:hypothetical protein
MTGTVWEADDGNRATILASSHHDFNPVGVVRPEDVARFFVDRHADDPTRSLVQRLTLNLQNSIEQPAPYKGLLTGHVGSGKSSELMRLG